MRTTVTIEDHLLAEVKQLAVRSDRTLGSVLEDAIRVYLKRVAKPASPDFELPVFTGRPGLQPGVDLDDREAIYDLLDDV